jgi:transcriptional regulator with XRE-family HTH domain
MAVTPVEVGRTVQACREDAGLTQADLAAKIGWLPGNIASLEGGRRPASLDALHRIAIACAATLEVRLVKR